METPKAVISRLLPGVGFRILSSFEHPDEEFVAKLREFGTPDISDQLNGLSALSPEIRQLAGSDERLSGPALTVKVPPGDNLMVHKSLDLARPGDVVVVDAGASTLNAVVGSTICKKASARGIAGFIVDGCVRDLPEIMALGCPVFARGTMPVGPSHRGPGEINFPISCGNRVVRPGDIVVGDRCGVVVVPSDHAAEICRRLSEARSRSAAYAASVERNEWSNQWAQDELERMGCRFIDR